jgi:hypothetical protein
MEIDYQTFMMVAYMITATVGITIYIARVGTRVAVLEANQGQMAEDLKEIKTDVKELLRQVHSGS